MTSFGEVKRTYPPTFIIIGAQKCGTTALFTYLATHPEIVAAEKELHFFDCDNRYAQGDVFYQGLFPAVSPHQLTFESSPSYLFNPKAPARIHAYNPDIKLIVLLRNPVDRAYSAWQMYKRMYEQNRNWFDDNWVSFCNNDLDIKKRSEDRIFCFHSYIEDELASLEKKIVFECSVVIRGHYAEQLQRYFKLFAKDQILIIESDSLRTQTQEVLKKIQSFLGIKYYEFDSGNLGPVLEGKYKEEMEERTRSLLEIYYKPHNEKLFYLLETQFSW
jgi:hypothetical protein